MLGQFPQSSVIVRLFPSPTEISTQFPNREENKRQEGKGTKPRHQCRARGARTRHSIMQWQFSQAPSRFAPISLPSSPPPLKPSAWGRARGGTWPVANKPRMFSSERAKCTGRLQREREKESTMGPLDNKRRAAAAHFGRPQRSAARIRVCAYKC